MKTTTWTTTKFESQPGTMAKLIDEVYLLHETNLLRLEKVAALSNTQKLTQRVKENEEIRNMFQTKWR